ncbi:low molecular weight protein-tyrosine-phosphatase [Enterococcus sp. LJL128]
MIRVLFVCLGNICRSPMAEAVMREKVKEAGLEEKIQVSSAATSGWEAGNPPHRGTRQILEAHDISVDGLRSTQINQQDFVVYDYIIGMDYSNLTDLKRTAPAGREENIHLFMSVVEHQEETEVPDPYYTGDFETTYRMVNEGTTAWLEHLKKEAGK